MSKTSYKTPWRFTAAIPLIFCLVMAVSDFLSMNWFEAGSWFILSFFGLLIAVPVIGNLDMKTVPVFQIFFSLLLGILFFSIASFFEFEKLGQPLPQAALFGVGIGFLIMAVLMMITFDFS